MTVGKLARIYARDVLRSRWILVYAGFFLLLSEGLLRFSGSDSKAILGLGSVMLMLVPLACWDCLNRKTPTDRPSISPHDHGVSNSHSAEESPGRLGRCWSRALR